MVGKNTLKDYELSCMEEYFEMIYMSAINGQWTQAKEQAKQLSKSQRVDFLDYLKDVDHILVKYFTEYFVSL